MDVGQIISLAAALGLGSIITKLIDAASDRAKEKRDSEGTAWEQRDHEARARRKLEETLHKTRRIAMDAGVPVEDLDRKAPWPQY